MPEPEAIRPRSRRPLVEGIAAAAGLCVFAVFVRSGLPLALLSACGLFAAALAIHRSLTGNASLSAVLGIARPSRRALILTAAGCALGIAGGGLYRSSSGQAFFPDGLRWFALVAGLIGGAEELAYRGYIQGRVRSLGAFPAVVLAALCHTAYKCALFLLPASPVEIDFCFLATFTLLAGLVVGALREISENVIPAIAAHVCFDIVVYGGLVRAPWWVWGA